MTSSLIPPLGQALLVERYKGVRGVGEDGCGGLFRELVPNLVVVHPLSNCRDTLGLEKEILEAMEGRPATPFFHNHHLERRLVLHAMFSLIL